MSVLFSEHQIDEKLGHLAPEIVADLGSSFTVVPILTGGFVFAADLCRALFRAGADPEIDFLQLASYGEARESSGSVRIVKDLAAPVEGQTVLIVDDVFDTGRSIQFAIDLMRGRGASRIATCVAVRKEKPRPVEADVDYALFETGGEAFLVGYGMDDAGGKRAMPDIEIIE
ncbi:MAG: phosphoribosyltransferase [Parvularcula sp.]